MLYGTRKTSTSTWPCRQRARCHQHFFLVNQQQHHNNSPRDMTKKQFQLKSTISSSSSSSVLALSLSNNADNEMMMFYNMNNDDTLLSSPIFIIVVIAGILLVLAQSFINQMLRGDQGLGAYLRDGSGYYKSAFRPATKNDRETSSSLSSDPLPWLKLPNLDYVQVAGQEKQQQQNKEMQFAMDELET